jgi:hypothetical protein
MASRKNETTTAKGGVQPPLATRFRPGNPGRPKGARHKVTMAVEALLQGEHEKLTRVAIDKALEGDTVALRLCLDRIAPPRKDADGVAAAGSAVIAALAAGDATPDEAARVMAVLQAQRQIIETVDLERRLSLLEGKEGADA